eukprot:TRINITY_DN11798_c0_g1_i2.p1 TRINITY_DN11798_c0_g1~~TRINITY_DN11798_c0_g1_i2.p1  ORF type:complete len:388 (+),score=46.22 TRINITY_DN11798_c0_g1_i2:65-1165(+)
MAGERKSTTRRRSSHVPPPVPSNERRQACTSSGDRRAEQERKPRMSQVQQGERRRSLATRAATAKVARNLARGYERMMRHPNRGVEKDSFAGLHTSLANGVVRRTMEPQHLEEWGRIERHKLGVKQYHSMNTADSSQLPLPIGHPGAGASSEEQRQEVDRIFGGAGGIVSANREWAKPIFQSKQTAQLRHSRDRAGRIARSPALERQLSKFYDGAAGNSNEEFNEVLEDFGLRPAFRKRRNSYERCWHGWVPARGRKPPNTANAAGQWTIKSQDDQRKAVYSFYPHNKSSVRENMLHHNKCKQPSQTVVHRATAVSQMDEKMNKEVVEMFDGAAGRGAATNTLRDYFGKTGGSGRTGQRFQPPSRQ